MHIQSTLQFTHGSSKLHNGKAKMLLTDLMKKHDLLNLCTKAKSTYRIISIQCTLVKVTSRIHAPQNYFMNEGLIKNIYIYIYN